MKPRTGTFRSALSFSVLSFASIGVITFGTSIVTARIYGIRVVGELALTLGPTSAVWVLSSVQEQPALIRKIAGLRPRDPAITGTWTAVFAFSMALTTIVTLLVAAVATVVLRGPLDRPDLVLPALASLGGYIVVTNPAWNLDSIFACFRAGGDLLQVRLHQAVVNLAATVAFGLAAKTVWGPVAALILSWSTSLVHRGWLVRRWMRLVATREQLRAGFRELREIVPFGLKTAPGHFANGASSESGTWVLGSLGTIPALGAYNRAWGLGQRLVELGWRITEILMPTLVERKKSGDQDGFDRAFLDTLRYAAIGLLLPASVLAGAAEPMMRVFGDAFTSGATTLGIIVLTPVFMTMTVVQAIALMAVGRPLAATAAGLIRLVVTLTASVPLTILFGSPGTAAGIVAGTLASCGVQQLLVRRHVSVPLIKYWPPRQFAGILVAYAAGMLAAHAATGLLAGPAALIPGFVAGTFAYVIAFVVVGGLTDRDRERLTSSWRSARGRFRGEGVRKGSASVT